MLRVELGYEVGEAERKRHGKLRLKRRFHEGVKWCLGWRGGRRLDGQEPEQ